MFIKKVEKKLYDKTIRNISLLYDEFDKIFNIIDNKEIEPLKEFLDYFINAKEFLKKCEEIFLHKTYNFSYPMEKIPTNFINLYKEFTKYENKFLIFSFENLLSSGQQSFLENFIRTYNFLTEDNYHNKGTNNILFCIDEGETSFHPNWQKEYIYNLIKFLSENFKEKEIHIIITSHSPFILSDIPKENVIFLDKFDNKTEKKYPKLKIDGLENGNCINVSKDIELKTFGANIHTLLSDGFFMSDGLMGEFAKSKITEVLDFLNDKEELRTIKEEQIKPIIESIGEDFLRNKLLDLYYKHKDFKIESKERKKQILDEKIKKLEEERDKLND